MVTEIVIEERLCQLAKGVDDQYALLELLRFLGGHPHARFSRLVIVHGLSSRRAEVEKALRHLVNKGVVREYVENNVLFYSLTEDQGLHNLVLHLANLDWPQWQLMFRQIYLTSAG